jgi:hypothetical protein
VTRDRPDVPMIVMLDQRLPAGAERELVGRLAEIGVPRVCRQPDLRAASELGFQMLIYVPVAAFLAAIGTELGHNSYRGLVAALRRLLDRRPAAAAEPSPPVAAEPSPQATGGPAAAAGLFDTGTAVLIVLEPGLPAAAYEQLRELDLDQFRPGPVRFRAGRWRSAG